MVQLQSAVFGLLQPLSDSQFVWQLPNVVLVIRPAAELAIGLAAVRDELPDGNAEGPHIRLVREHSLPYAFQRQPLYWHSPALCLVLILVDVEKSSKSEIGDLDPLWRLHENVPGRQIPVNQAPTLQISHAPGNLQTPVEQRLRPDLVLIVLDVVEETA